MKEENQKYKAMYATGQNTRKSALWIAKCGVRLPREEEVREMSIK